MSPAHVVRGSPHRIQRPVRPFGRPTGFGAAAALQARRATAAVEDRGCASNTAMSSAEQGLEKWNP